MAQLHVQEKRSKSWMWILGLILLALLAWMFMRPDAERDVVGGDVDQMLPAPVLESPTAADTTAAAGGVITDLSALTDETNWATTVGQRVALMGVPVSEAVSDKGFWIGRGTAAGESVFAVRTQQDAAATAPDGSVTSGTTVNLWGVVTAMPANLSAQTATWNLRSTDVERLSGHRIYIHVDSARLAGR